MSDIIPDSAQNIYDWAVNYLAQLPAIATRITWPTTAVTALTAQLTAVRDAAKAVLDAQNALKGKMGLLNQAKANNIPGIRQSTANLKSTPGFNEGDAKTLNVTTATSTGFDPNTYKPEIKVESHVGFNEITGKKRGVQSLNFYVRVKGSAKWNPLASKRSTFPFHDDSPPAASATTEEREYMAMGVINDEEIGQPSDIASAVFRSL